MERMIAQAGLAETLVMIPDALPSRSVVRSKNKRRNGKKVKQILLMSFALICATFFGCKSSAAHHGVEFVDRSATFSQDILPQQLRLIVEIDEGGTLRLNKIETGTTHDMSLLAEKLEVIFADREKFGIDEREVLIDPKINIETERYEELIKVLSDANATPIRVIRNDR